MSSRMRNMPGSVGIDVSPKNGYVNGDGPSTPPDSPRQQQQVRRRPQPSMTARPTMEDGREHKLHSSPFRRSMGKLVIMAQTKIWCRFGSQALCSLVSVVIIVAWTGGFHATGTSGSRGIGHHHLPGVGGSTSLPHPRTLFYYFDNDGWADSKGPRRTDPERVVNNDYTLNPMSLSVERLMPSKQRRKIDAKYDKYRREVPIPPCDYQYEWQKSSFPSCNVVHESFMGDPMPFLINNGGWVDIFAIMEYDGELKVLKTKRYKHDFTDRNYDRYRRDALSMERLTFAPNVLDMFGFCGVTAVVDYADGGDIENFIDGLLESNQDIRNRDRSSPEFEKIQQDKLRIAQQMLSSIALMHTFEKNGRPSIAHTDISPYQFITKGDGNFVLNDFNRARFIGWNRDTDEACPFRVANNPGKWRAPEEYRYDEENEKVDVYSAGNVLYYLLTETKPFDDEDQKLAKKIVMKGKRPHIPSRLMKSEHPVDIALMKAMDLCWTHDPKDRPSAKMIAAFLEEEREKLKDLAGN